MTEIELCWRCGASMNWVQSTWQCPRCRWKLGCCEGEPQSCVDPTADAHRVEPATG